MTLREKFQAGQPLGALWLSLGSAAIAEFAAASAPDLIVIDRQHGLWDRTSLEAGVAAAARGAPVMVRLADHLPTSVSEALDAGAEAVLAPLVETETQARAIVSAAHFPLKGTRSGGGVRPGLNFAAYVERARRDTVVGAMIETEAALANLHAIAAVEGIDFLFIGTGDLALSLNEFPAPGERHGAACDAVRKACERAGKPCGAFAFSAAMARSLFIAGFRLVTIGSDLDILREGFAAASRIKPNSGSDGT